MKRAEDFVKERFPDAVCVRLSLGGLAIDIQDTTTDISRLFMVTEPKWHEEVWIFAANQIKYLEERKGRAKAPAICPQCGGEGRCGGAVCDDCLDDSED